MRAVALAGLLAAGVALVAPRAAGAQSPPLRIEGRGEVSSVPGPGGPGIPAVSVSVLEHLGWTVRAVPGGVVASRDGGALRLTEGNPFVRWEGRVYQLAEAPYRAAGGLAVPGQLLSELLPAIRGDLYTFDAGAGILRVAGRGAADLGSIAGAGGGEPRAGSARPASTRHSRLVVIDPGHGGRDPGTVGRRGTREKDVALDVGIALARELRRDSTLDVRLTRDDDVLVPLWKRGELATRWKEGRPAVFVSLHANAMPGRRSTRGFETYFLSDARTDHERRVAALENSAVEYEDRGAVPVSDDSELAFILNELRNLDTAHWSALLAEKIQDGLAPVHPGPNRGVKQAPLAVVTNAVMPAVLVEIGFLSHRAEESLLVRSSFHGDAAEAMAGAIRDFFRRYPPGPDVAAGGR